VFVCSFLLCFVLRKKKRDVVLQRRFPLALYMYLQRSLFLNNIIPQAGISWAQTPDSGI
jgi:hypothetical protein